MKSQISSSIPFLLALLSTITLTNCFVPINVKATTTSAAATILRNKQRLYSSSSKVDTSEYDLSLFSPCKINLFLRIIRKRPDNFHDLASLFQTIGFGDTLHLKLLEDGEDEKKHDQDVFECNMEGVPTDKSNLVIRALDLVREKTGNQDKVQSLLLCHFNLFHTHVHAQFLFSYVYFCF